MKVTYSSNNSGGSWWLTDQNWLDLEAAGWDVQWFRDEPDTGWGAKGERWLGGLASEASLDDVESLGVAVAEWEHVTGLRAADPGCQCCGEPHSFYADDYSEFWDGHDRYDDDDYY